MNDYQRVEDALKAGAEPQLLCDTCPWDRFCIVPPELTADDVERQMEEAKRKDLEAAEQAEAQGKEVPMPVGMLLTAVTFGGKHLTARLCPVFALRLKTREGKGIVDGIKAAMQTP